MLKNKVTIITFSSLNKYKKGISFTLNKNAKILNIDSIDKYISLLMDHHEIMDRRVYYEGIIAPDWNYSINNYDAVHVECDLIYNYTLRYNMLPVNINDIVYKANGFYSYDAESWLIINPDCINKGSILNHSIDMKKLELLEG